MSSVLCFGEGVKMLDLVQTQQVQVDVGVGVGGPSMLMMFLLLALPGVECNDSLGEDLVLLEL